MKKQKLLFATNILLFLLILNQLTTVLIKDFVDPEFFEIHEIGGFLLIALVLVHLVLNWGWVRSNVFAKAK